jgi:ATP-dependent Lon protease
VATAVAWTENGGEIMPVEVLILEGKGNLQITGQIGEMMQESAQAALSYLKWHSRDFGLDPEMYEGLDIHIHIPEGAIPKDGPSAGITIATALISAFTERKVYKEVGMTGEITLRGRVLPVGGVREKDPGRAPRRAEDRHPARAQPERPGGCAQEGAGRSENHVR